MPHHLSHVSVRPLHPSQDGVVPHHPSHVSVMPLHLNMTLLGTVYLIAFLSTLLHYIQVVVSSYTWVVKFTVMRVRSLSCENSDAESPAWDWLRHRHGRVREACRPPSTPPYYAPFGKLSVCWSFLASASTVVVGCSRLLLTSKVTVIR